MLNRLLLLLLIGCCICGEVGVLAPARLFATEESWKTTFDRTCGQTDNAAGMSVEELKKAVASCDALKPQIEALEATPRKIYLKRLQMCRNLFVYLLESKEKK